MKKVFIVHGLHGWPNGGWRVWLMGDLDKKEIYACALSLPNIDNPICRDWVEEITRQVEMNKDDEIYLVGHSLGSTAILRYLESLGTKVAGAVLVSGPIKSVENKVIENFLDKPFDFEKIKTSAKRFVVIHGDNDSRVPFEHAEILSKELGCKLVTVQNGGHLTGSEGWKTQPQVLENLIDIMGLT